jgi:hypothetical protein
MTEDEKKKIKLRTDMVDVLLEMHDEMLVTNGSSIGKSEIQKHAIFIMFIATSLVVWFAGKPDHETLVVVAFFATFICGYFLFIVEYSFTNIIVSLKNLLLKK